MKYYALFNPFAGNGKCLQDVKLLEENYKDIDLIDMTTVSYEEFFGGLEADDTVIICGGDGTLNRFVNDTFGIDIGNDILYYPVGTGNDFAHDLGKKAGDQPFKINEYLTDLPYVYVNGQKHLFLNGIGYGIDGYCCEVGDRLKEKSDKPVNYTSIAIKGLLFHFKRPNATVIVDGKEHSYKKVWLAPAMNGRFYGGGMMPAPEQDRLNKERTISLVALFGSGKLKTLLVFPSLFKGEHVKHTEMVEIIKGHDITVRFDRPTALQIDGETVLNVTEYRAVAACKDK